MGLRTGERPKPADVPQMDQKESGKTVPRRSRRTGASTADAYAGDTHRKGGF